MHNAKPGIRPARLISLIAARSEDTARVVVAWCAAARHGDAVLASVRGRRRCECGSMPIRHRHRHQLLGKARRITAGVV